MKRHIPGEGLVLRASRPSEVLGESAGNREKMELMTGHLYETSKGNLSLAECREQARGCALRADARGKR
tara:strand:- start:4281 stop:4487 length:207 start_codon:yes stop_codon:yes gene_type:complete